MSGKTTFNDEIAQIREMTLIIKMRNLKNIHTRNQKYIENICIY